MKRIAAIIAIATAALLLPGSSVAQTVPAEDVLGDLMTSTDGYAAWAVDTCLRTGGFVTAAPGETVSVSGSGLLVLLPAASDVVNPDSLAFPQDAAPDPCCICGIYDPVSGTLKGCAAISGPCCCLASLKPSGQIDCSCQGGKACGGANVATYAD